MKNFRLLFVLPKRSAQYSAFFLGCAVLCRFCFPWWCCSVFSYRCECESFFRAELVFFSFLHRENLYTFGAKINVSDGITQLLHKCQFGVASPARWASAREARASLYRQEENRLWFMGDGVVFSVRALARILQVLLSRKWWNSGNVNLSWRWKFAREALVVCVMWRSSVMFLKVFHAKFHQNKNEQEEEVEKTNSLNFLLLH